MTPSTRVKRASAVVMSATATGLPSQGLETNDVGPADDTKPDSSSTGEYTTLRRSTRSSTGAITPTSSTSLNLSRYAYNPVTPPRKRVKVEPREDELDTKLLVQTPMRKIKDEPEDDRLPTPRSSSKKMPQLALDKPHKEPDRWREQYRLIEHMRKGIIAPVDDMGCERPRTTTDAEPKTLRFHILISLMLSSQTKDPVTSAAVTNLHTTLPGGLTAQSLAEASIETVHECINKVGFWRRKTEYIQEAAKKLLEQEGEERGDVPKTLEGLCELKGVGPKMAFLCLQCAWDINAGIGVDVHVHRITNRLRWHKPQTTQPEQTRLNLQSWLPSELHKPINPMMVGFGQVICLPVGPRCDVCLLAKAKLCPSRIANVKSEGRKEVVFTFTDPDGDIKLDSDEALEALEGSSSIKVEYETVPGPSSLPSGTKVKKERSGTPIAEIKPEPESPTATRVRIQTVPTTAPGNGSKDMYDDKGGLPSELAVHPMAKEDDPVIDEEGVLDILDQVDGTKEIGDVL